MSLTLFWSALALIAAWVIGTGPRRAELSGELLELEQQEPNE
jgi:hypothetical protein